MSERRDQKNPDISRDRNPELSPDSERFVADLAENYAPEPPTPAREQAFDAALYERLDEPVLQPLWRPALATALACAAIGWLLLPPVETPESAPALEALAAIVEEGAAFEDETPELLTANEVLDFEDESEDEFLPDDYLAIGGFLLDG